MEIEKDKYVEIERKGNVASFVYIPSKYPGPIAINAIPPQPERSKREDFYHKRQDFYHRLLKDYLDREEHWEIGLSERMAIECFASWLDERCGALNIVETQ